MSLGDFSDISTGKNFPPLSDGDRQARIVANRELYHGRWRALGVADEYNSSKREYPVRFNLFRRIPQFFGELMFGSPPEITASGRGQAFVDMTAAQLAAVYQRALVDMLRYGSGVPAVDLATGMPVSYQPDQWFAVSDGVRIVGDVIAYVTNNRTGDIRLDGLANPTPIDNRRTLHATFLPVEGEGRQDVYDFNGGSIGARRETNATAKPPMRMVAPVFHGYAFNEQGVSIYDDYKENVGEIARRLSGLSATLQRNQRPHMFVDGGSVKGGDKPSINVDGELFIVNPGGIVPGYIQYDARLDAVKYDIEQNFNYALMACGISPLLFSVDPSRAGAVLSSDSGRAIRRLMLPTFARLAQYKRIMEASMRQLIPAMAAVFAMRGGERIEINPMDLTFRWEYEEIFGDGGEPSE